MYNNSNRGGGKGGSDTYFVSGDEKNDRLPPFFWHAFDAPVFLILRRCARAISATCDPQRLYVDFYRKGGKKKRKKKKKKSEILNTTSNIKK